MLGLVLWCLCLCTVEVVENDETCWGSSWKVHIAGGRVLDGWQCSFRVGRRYDERYDVWRGVLSANRQVQAMALLLPARDTMPASYMAPACVPNTDMHTMRLKGRSHLLRVSPTRVVQRAGGS